MYDLRKFPTSKSKTMDIDTRHWTDINCDSRSEGAGFFFLSFKPTNIQQLKSSVMEKEGGKQ